MEQVLRICFVQRWFNYVMVKIIFHQVSLFCKAITVGFLTNVLITQFGHLSRAGMKPTDQQIIYIQYITPSILKGGGGIGGGITVQN